MCSVLFTSFMLCSDLVPFFQQMGPSKYENINKSIVIHFCLLHHKDVHTSSNEIKSGQEFLNITKSQILAIIAITPFVHDTPLGIWRTNICLCKFLYHFNFDKMLKYQLLENLLLLHLLLLSRTISVCMTLLLGD